MNFILNALKSTYDYAIELNDRKRTLDYLQTQTDRNLLDKGFAPHLVAEGLAGYPWAVTKDVFQPFNLPTTVAPTATVTETVVTEETEYKTAA